jgi:2-polyprenyl-3-methyl-5-hydroxy-6-metoxy-1,4-benzoquinol methylase
VSAITSLSLNLERLFPAGRRSVERRARSATETGVLLIRSEPARIGLYAIVEHNVAVLLEQLEGGVRLAPIPKRERVVLNSRYPDRRLVFPDDPMRAASPPRNPQQYVAPNGTILPMASLDRDQLFGLVARRPVERWSRPATDTGVLLIDDEPGRMGLYAVLEDDVAVLLEPLEAGLRLTPIPTRERVALASRYPDRRLAFPDDPTRVVWAPREPLQHVEPTRINLVLIRKGLRAARRGGLRGGTWDEEVLDRPFEETDFFAALREHFIDGSEWESVGAVGAVLRDLTGAELRERDNTLEAVDALYRAIRTEGYRTQPELPSGQRGDEISVAIGRDGRYRLIQGRMRLALARLLGLRTVPVRVVTRHRSWERFRERIIAYAGRHRGRVYQRIEHPDLIDLRSHHDDEGGDRVPIIVSAFDGYDPAGKRLMDLGAHWGQMSQRMERLGFEVTAVEADEKSAGIAARLRTATESRFEVWCGSAFEFPRLREQNVLLALNIFHHFIKTEENHTNLVALLERLDADIIVFAAHSSTASRHMRNAYRNYEPLEFAEFVSVHSRLPNIKLLGHSGDRRPLFRLSR